MVIDNWNTDGDKPCFDSCLMSPQEIIEHYGLNHQINKLGEELDELNKEVEKAYYALEEGRFGLRNRVGLAEEMSDVMLLIEQISGYLSLCERMEFNRELKLRKVEEEIVREMSNNK